MKRVFSLLAAVSVAMIATWSSAEVITPDYAKAVADNFLSLDSEWQGHQEASVRLVESDGVAAYYVVEYDKGGWAIVAAQLSSDPIIGYNTTDAYVVPEPMQAVLDANAKRIVEEARVKADSQHEAWQRIMQRKPAADPANVPDVAPLVTVDLNQGDPYNRHCPSVGGERVMVGCVAVGMAQAMMVQEYPLRPVGQYSYTCEGIGKLSIDYDAEKAYDWEAMLNSDKTGDYDEVARLLYHCGVSVAMGYGVDGSGAGNKPVPKALVRNFSYDENYIQLVSKEDKGEEWLNFLLDELILGRVVIYFGAGDGGAHCWNIDGWKNSTQKVHVNWGWGGYGNGYFDIDKMQDDYQGLTFPYANSAIVGVGTPTTAPYGIVLSNTRFTAGTAAGVALADVKVACEDAEAVFNFELKGPKNIAGKHVASPYEVKDGKLMSTKTVEDAAAFREIYMTVTNTNTGESFDQLFKVQIVADNAVESVMSDAMRVYPSVADSYINVEVPAVGGEYAIYSVAGAQVQAGELAAYKTEVNVSSLAAGTYILRYVHGEGVGVKTFIKK